MDATVDFVLAIHPAATAAPYLWPCSWAKPPDYPAGARATLALMGMAAADVTEMYFLQHNYPVACTRTYFLQGIMAG